MPAPKRRAAKSPARPARDRRKISDPMAADFMERLHHIPNSLCAGYAPLLEQHPSLYASIEEAILDPTASLKTRGIGTLLLCLDASPQAARILAAELKQLAGISQALGLAEAARRFAQGDEPERISSAEERDTTLLANLAGFGLGGCGQAGLEELLKLSRQADPGWAAPVQEALVDGLRENAARFPAGAPAALGQIKTFTGSEWTDDLAESAAWALMDFGWSSAYDQIMSAFRRLEEGDDNFVRNWRTQGCPSGDRTARFNPKRLLDSALSAASKLIIYHIDTAQQARRNAYEKKLSKYLDGLLATLPEGNAAPDLGRNQPCHCNSGKKYKKCCLEADLQAARPHPWRHLLEGTQPMEGLHLHPGKLKTAEQEEYFQILRNPDTAQIPPDNAYLLWVRCLVFMQAGRKRQGFEAGCAALEVNAAHPGLDYPIIFTALLHSFVRLEFWYEWAGAMALRTLQATQNRLDPLSTYSWLEVWKRAQEEYQPGVKMLLDNYSLDPWIQLTICNFVLDCLTGERQGDGAPPGDLLHGPDDSALLELITRHLEEVMEACREGRAVFSADSPASDPLPILQQAHEEILEQLTTPPPPPDQPPAAAGIAAAEIAAPGTPLEEARRTYSRMVGALLDLTRTTQEPPDDLIEAALPAWEEERASRLFLREELHAESAQVITRFCDQINDAARQGACYLQENPAVVALSHDWNPPEVLGIRVDEALAGSSRAEGDPVRQLAWHLLVECSLEEACTLAASAGRLAMEENFGPPQIITEGQRITMLQEVPPAIHDPMELAAVSIEEHCAALGRPSPQVKILPDCTRQVYCSELPPSPPAWDPGHPYVIKAQRMGLEVLELAAREGSQASFAGITATAARSRPAVGHVQLERVLVPEPLPAPSPPLPLEQDLHPLRAGLRRVLRRLIRIGKIGESHTSIDNFARGLPLHLKGPGREAAELLLKAGMLRRKPTLVGLHISIENEALPDIEHFINTGLGPNPEVEEFLAWADGIN